MIRATSKRLHEARSVERSLVRKTLETERRTLASLRVRRRLARALGEPGGLARFAEAFYFIRYDFYRVNFLVGSRSGPHERFWRGLVANLREELGGEHGRAHNELYRRFLRAVGTRSEGDLSEPAFAERFNSKWDRFCRTAPFEQALSAIGVYEILDNPDYRLLHSLMKQAKVPASGLEFFAVHANVRHFELFSDVVRDLWSLPRGSVNVRRAAEFVKTMQLDMWTGLLTWMERTDEIPRKTRRFR